MNYVTTADGTRLFCREWGAGDPVVFVHGWTMGASMWDYQIDFLASHGYRAIAYDQRGCGRSDWPSSGYDFDTLADDLRLVLEQRGLRRVTIVTYSMGAGVLTRYLARFGAGDRIRRAVLVSPDTPCLLKSPDNPDGMDRALVYEPFLAGLRTDRPRTLASSAPVWFGQAGVSPEMTQWVLELCRQSDPVAMNELFRHLNEADLRGDLSAFRVPTLIVHGADDVYAPAPITACRIAEAIPGSQLVLYEGASHGLFVTHRERLHADLLRFLRRCDG